MKKKWHRGPDIGAYWTEIVERGDSGPSMVVAKVRTKRLEGVYSGEQKIVECQEGEANLRLLMAALELLGACKAVDEWLMEGFADSDADDPVYNEAFRRALRTVRAAIAKATGGEG